MFRIAGKLDKHHYIGEVVIPVVCLVIVRQVGQFFAKRWSSVNETAAVEIGDFAM
jgi:hypothetical protein